LPNEVPNEAAVPIWGRADPAAKRSRCLRSARTGKTRWVCEATRQVKCREATEELCAFEAIGVNNPHESQRADRTELAWSAVLPHRWRL